MKSVLISIQPKWCELIASGKKTVEVRKSKPKLETPFKVYIYATKPKKYYKISSCLAASDECLYLSNGKVKMCNGFEFWADGVEYEFLSGKVVGEFVCDRIRCENEVADGLVDIVLESTSCVGYEELLEYANGNVLYSWHISDLVIYDKPKELSEFTSPEWFRDCEKGCPDMERMRCPVKDSRKAGKMCGWCRKGGKPITRPPQSWCYVEEVSNNG